MTRYDYEELKEKALTFGATQEEINNLGEWFERFGDRYWNGEYFDIDNEHRLYRIMKEVDEGEWETVGYEIK